MRTPFGPHTYTIPESAAGGVTLGVVWRTPI
jgi:hypothetical protein